MAVGITILIVAVVVIAIWVLIEVKRLKHKVFAVFLIALILFVYISGTMVFKGQDIDYQSVSGMSDAAGIYFSWLGGIFSNFKSITSYAVDQDWESDNETSRR